MLNVNCHSDFFFIVLIFVKNETKNKMKNSCPHLGSNPGPSAYDANALSVELLELIYIVHLKVTAFLPEGAIQINLYHVLDLVKYFVG